MGANYLHPLCKYLSTFWSKKLFFPLCKDGGGVGVKLKERFFAIVVTFLSFWGGGKLLPCNATDSAQKALPPDEGLAVGFGYLALWLCGKLRPARPRPSVFISTNFLRIRLLCQRGQGSPPRPYDLTDRKKKPVAGHTYRYLQVVGHPPLFSLLIIQPK